MDDLIDIGFKRAGCWTHVDGKLRLQLDQLQPACPALYAFIIERNVKYVGKTIRSVSQRLSGYLKPGPTQRTNERVRRRILEALKSGAEVHILVFEDPNPCCIGRFNVSAP